MRNSCKHIPYIRYEYLHYINYVHYIDNHEYLNDLENN